MRRNGKPVEKKIEMEKKIGCQCRKHYQNIIVKNGRFSILPVFRSFSIGVVALVLFSFLLYDLLACFIHCLILISLLFVSCWSCLSVLGGWVAFIAEHWTWREKLKQLSHLKKKSDGKHDCFISCCHWNEPVSEKEMSTKKFEGGKGMRWLNLRNI